MKRLRADRVYFAHAFWMGLSTSVAITYYMVFQVETALLSPLQLVLAGTALEISAFVFEIPTGVVADVYSRRLSVIIGVFITGLGFILQGIPNFAAILIGAAVWGLGYTFTSGAHQAWITDEVGPDQAGRVFLRGRQYGQAGGLAGIPASMALAGVSYQLPILTGGALIFTLGFFLLAAMGEDEFTPAPRAERETWKAMRETLQEGAALVRRQPILRDFFLIGLFVGLYSEGYDRLWTAHLLEEFTLPDIPGPEIVVLFGLIRVADSLLGIALNEFARRRLEIESMVRSVRALQGLYAVMIIALATFAWTRSFPLALVMLLAFNAGRGLTFPIQDAWTNQFIDSRVRATVLSVQSQVDALGQMAGGPVIGAAGSRYGIRAAMGLAAAILLPVVPLYQAALRKSRSER